MFGILGVILIFILLIILTGFALIGNILRFIFGFGKKASKYHYEKQANQTDTTYTSSTSSASASRKKKIFDDDEGEYVEFEEVE